MSAISPPNINDEDSLKGKEKVSEPQNLVAALVRSVTGPRPPLASPSDEPPDGGLVAWLQVLGSFLLFFSSWGMVNSFGVFQTYYTEDLLSHQSESNISWIGSLQAFLLLAFTLVGGPLHDLGHTHMQLLVCSALAVFGLMMTSLCTEYWQFMLAQGVCMGLGFGGVFITSVAITPSYFSKKRGLALGIAASGSSIGGIIYPVIFHKLQPIIGFPWATRVMAFILLVTLGVAILLMKVRVTSPPAPRPFLDMESFKNLRYNFFNIANFMGFVGLYIPFFYIQQYATSVTGTSSDLAFYTLALLNAGSVFGRIGPGFLADKLGPLPTLLFCSVVSTVLAFAWIAIRNTSGVLAFCFLYGFFSGTFVSLQAVAVTRLVPHMGLVGTWMGMSATYSGLGLLVGNPVAGVLLNSGWIGLQCFCGGTVAVACFFIFLTIITKPPADGKISSQG